MENRDRSAVKKKMEAWRRWSFKTELSTPLGVLVGVLSQSMEDLPVAYLYYKDEANDDLRASDMPTNYRHREETNAQDLE